MSVAKQTVNAYIQTRLRDLDYKSANGITSLGLNPSGTLPSNEDSKYLQLSSSITQSLQVLDSQLFHVASTYATLSDTISSLQGIKNSAPESLDTLKEIADSLNNDSNFAANFLSTIGAEISLATSSEDALRSDLNNEIARKVPVESLLQSDLLNKIGSSTQNDSQLITDLSGEIQRASLTQETLLQNITNEITTRVQSIQDLSNSIHSRLMDVSGNFFSTIAAEAERARAAELQILNDLSGEILRSTTEDSSYRIDLSGEILRASLSQSTLRGNLAEEISRATAVSSTLSGRISTIELFYIKQDGSVPATANLDVSSNFIQNLATPVDSGDIVTKEYITNSINSLGNVFSYRDVITLADNNDLSTLPHKEVGSAYKVKGTGSVITNYTIQNEIDFTGVSDVLHKTTSGFVLYVIKEQSYMNDLIVKYTSILDDGSSILRITPGTEAEPYDMRNLYFNVDYTDTNKYIIPSSTGFIKTLDFDGVSDKVIQVIQDKLYTLTYLNNVSDQNTGLPIEFEVDGVIKYKGIYTLDNASFVYTNSGNIVNSADNELAGSNVVAVNETLAPGFYYTPFTAGYFRIASRNQVFTKYFVPSYYFYVNDIPNNTITYFTQFSKENTLTFPDISTTTPQSPYNTLIWENTQALATLFGTEGKLVRIQTDGYIRVRYLYDIYFIYINDTNQDVWEGSGEIQIIQLKAGDFIYGSFPYISPTEVQGNIRIIPFLTVDSQPSLTLTNPPVSLFSSTPTVPSFIVDITQTGFARITPSAINTGFSKFVQDGDILVSKGDDWDILRNTDFPLTHTSGRTLLTGDAFTGYTVSISPNYVGQSTITTVGTLTEGTWKAETIGTAFGGFGISTWNKGDLIVGNPSNSLSALPLGSQGTFLLSDGTNVSWVPANTSNIKLTSQTNFSTLTNLQEAIDKLFDSFQKRSIVQFVRQTAGFYAAPDSYNPNLLSGKINFIDFESGIGRIYLPQTSTPLEDGTIIRLVWNGISPGGNIVNDNLIVACRNSETQEDVDILQIAPNETTAFIWNDESKSWLVGIGI